MGSSFEMHLMQQRHGPMQELNREALCHGTEHLQRQGQDSLTFKMVLGCLVKPCLKNKSEGEPDGVQSKKQSDPDTKERSTDMSECIF